MAAAKQNGPSGEGVTQRVHGTIQGSLAKQDMQCPRALQ